MRRASAFALVAATLVAGLVSAPASATSITSASWYPKYQWLSTHHAHKAAPTSAPVFVGPNVDVSNEQGPQSETSISVDPSAPRHLVAGSNEIVRLPMRGYFSSDGGRSWGGVDLPLPPPRTTNGYDFGSDPGVAWDTRGNVYYSYIIVFWSSFGITGTEAALARSSDGGRTWKAIYWDFHKGESKFVDKTMITVDTNPSSPHRDTIYVTYDHAGGNPTNAAVEVHSTDLGKTVSTPVFASEIVSGNNGAFGTQPFVDPGGGLHVAWLDYAHSLIATSASTDGGKSFGPTVTIAPTQIVFDIDIPAQASRGAVVYPACGADRSPGPYRGRLYCSWMDGDLDSGTDIFLSHSTDGGASWSPPIRVNDDAASAVNDQFNGWLDVDPVTGAVALMWHDTRNDPSRLTTNIYLGVSSNGGATVGANRKITTEPTDETSPDADPFNQYGDYDGIAVYNGVAHPVWTDRRASLPTALGEEVFTARVRIA